MWFYDVLAFKHMSDDHQAALTQTVIDTLKSVQYHKYVVIKEMGESGCSPHLNIIYDVVKESHGKSFTQVLKRRVVKLDKNALSRHTIRHKRINNEIQLANVICGYLTKESVAEQICLYKIDVQELEKLREVKKFDSQEKASTVLKCQLFNLYTNYYKQNYSEVTFTKKLFKDMTIEIASSKDLATHGCLKCLRELYPNLECYLTNNNANMSNYLDLVLHEYF